ncbi:MAG: KH domain-containing protein, partial [Erysipelotrichaceae bacterium]|nr:KH domain-containing protein [Erysipelotrichaceae bacterium]
MKKYEAKNLDEALKAAAADKHVKIEDLKYYVLEEKPGGLFGIGSKAIIEAYTFNDVRDFIESYLKQYFDNIGMNVELIVNKLDDNSFNVIVNANNNAILIGKNGQTLEAM